MICQLAMVARFRQFPTTEAKKGPGSIPEQLTFS
ncbi:uncharacterized protein METZ01_LOCUS54435 [marine metagenome]|uniref:Uncharacterized protein n=1 Tax=marine metagenome TaxID=408172 RepID=A0A381SE40_9ZZZZ